MARSAAPSNVLSRMFGVIKRRQMGTLSDAHPDAPIYLYDADHGFYSDDRPDYRVEPAALSKLRTLQLFHQAASGKVEI